MFKFLSKFVILSTFVMSAHAVDFSGDASFASRYLYRGEQFGDSTSLGVDATLKNLGFTGLFLDGKFNTLNTTPVNGNVKTRSDVGVGYALNFKGIDLSASVNRVINSPDYINDYTEFRTNASYDFLGIKGYGGIAQIISSNVPRDTYANVGVEGPVYQNLIVGASAGFKHYRDYAASKFNDASVYAKYYLTDYLNLSATYSFGGNNFDNTHLDNHANVAVTYQW